MKRHEPKTIDPNDFDLDEYHRVPGLMFRVELVLLTIYDGELQLLMMERDQPPCEDMLVLPGGYLREDRGAEETAHTLCLKLRMPTKDLTQFGLYSDVNRDSRTRLISAAYLNIVSAGTFMDLKGSGSKFRIITVNTSGAQPELQYEYEKFKAGFDHGRIALEAIHYLRAMLDNSMLAFKFLPEEFSLSSLRQVHELIRGRPLETMRFRKRMTARIFQGGLRLRAIGKSIPGKGRPAELYRLCKPGSE